MKYRSNSPWTSSLIGLQALYKRRINLPVPPKKRIRITPGIGQGISGSRTSTLTESGPDKMRGLGINVTYDRRRYRAGRRPKKNVYQLWKRVKQGTESLVLRYQALNKFDSLTAGYTPLKFYETTDGGAQYYPCHLLNLTGRPNFVRDTPSGTSTLFNPYVRYYLTNSKNDGTGAYAWEPMKKIGANGSTSAGLGTAAYWAWDVEYSDHGQFSNNAPLDADTLDWIQMKYMFYGTVNLPVKYCVQIVQFNEEWIAPQTKGCDFPVGTGSVTYDPGTEVPDTKGQMERNAFLSSLVQPYVFSPLVQTNYKQNPGRLMKVIKSYNFTINPCMSTDLASGASGTTITPHQRQVDIFLRFNRKQKYDWEGRQQVDVDAATFAQTTQNQINIDVHPSARLYCIVRATCAEVETGTLANWPTAAYTTNTRTQPSYDLVIRKKHSKLSFR